MQQAMMHIPGIPTITPVATAFMARLVRLLGALAASLWVASAYAIPSAQEILAASDAVRSSSGSGGRP